MYIYDDRGITGFFEDGNQYKELHEDIIRNSSIRHTSVQSKTNTKTDSSRIENSHDEIYKMFSYVSWWDIYK